MNRKHYQSSLTFVIILTMSVFFRKDFCLLYLFFALFILFISVWVFGDPEIHSLQFEIRSVPGKLLCMRHYYTKGHLRISHTSAMRKEHTSL